MDVEANTDTLTQLSPAGDDDAMVEPLAAEVSKEFNSAVPNPMEEIDESEVVASAAPPSPVAPSNTPITGDSGQTSPVMEVSSDGLSDDGQKDQSSILADSNQVVSEELLTNGQAETLSNPKLVSDQNAESTDNVSTIGTNLKETKKDDKKSSNTSSKNKKKEDKSIEYILRALNSLQSPEEKLAALCKKYADLHEEHRVLQTSFKSQQRSMTVIMREKDQIQSEHAKAVIAKGRLESLCRELQKHNKLVKEESIQRAKEDDEKRRELSTKFQTTIGEIQTQMSSNNERNTKLQEENMALATQLKEFVEQYETREQKMRQHRDLEQQVAEAKITRANALLKEEQEKSNKEKELLLHKIAESTKKVNLLEAQVRVFKDRYDEFESLHTRSNETFQKYKTEMDKMGKRIKKLEKDGLAWKSKWETTNKSLLDMTEAKGKSEAETKKWLQKTKTLESLCRALQEKLHEKPTSAPQADASKETVSPTSEVPPNSPEGSSGQASPESSVTPSSEEAPSNPPLTASLSESQNEEQSALETAVAANSSIPTAPEVSSSSPQTISSGDDVPSQNETPAAPMPSDSDSQGSVNKEPSDS